MGIHVSEQQLRKPGDCHPPSVVSTPQIECSIPPGIRRSQEAYWADLPKLLRRKTQSRRWVAYHNDKRIGFAATSVELYQKCLRRGLKTDAIYIDRVEPRRLPPWQAEEIDVSSESMDSLFDQPSASAR